eukprot:7973-Heterococcus_DN1.PRE.5
MTVSAYTQTLCVSSRTKLSRPFDAAAGAVVHSTSVDFLQLPLDPWAACDTANLNALALIVVAVDVLLYALATAATPLTSHWCGCLQLTALDNVSVSRGSVVLYKQYIKHYYTV